MTINEKGFDVDIYEKMVLQDSKLPPLGAHSICLHADKSVVISGKQNAKLLHNRNFFYMRNFGTRFEISFVGTMNISIER